MTQRSPIIFVVLFMFSFALTQLIYWSLPDAVRVNESLDYNLFYYVIAERLSASEPFDTAFWFSSLTETAIPVSRDLPGEFVTHYPPGMPVMLSFLIKASTALQMDPNTVIRLFFDILFSSSASLIFLLARQLATTRHASLTAFLWATYPLNLWLTKQPNSEIPFLFCFILSILALVRSINSSSFRWCLISGFALGLAINFRAAGVMLPFVFCLIIILFENGGRFQIPSKKTIKLSTILITVPYLMILPWELKMYNNTGKFIPVASSAQDMSKNMDKFFLTPGPDGSLIVSDTLKRYIVDRNCGKQREFFYDQFCKNEAAATLSTTEALIANIEFIWLRLSRPFYGTFTKRYETHVLILNSFYLVMTLIGGILITRAKRYEVAHLCLPIFAYFLLLSLMVIPVTRYMVPAIGISLIFIPYCLDSQLLRNFWYKK